MGEASIWATRFFLFNWTCFLIAKASWIAGTAEANCKQNFGTDDAFYSRLCKGYTAAAVFNMFGAICSLMAAMAGSRESWKICIFLISVTFYALGLTCENGGEASGLSAQSPSDDFRLNEEEYYSAATVFFFFSAVPAAVAVVYAYKAMAWQTLLSFNVFLGLYSLGWVCLGGGMSKTAYDAISNDKQSAYVSENRVKYHGFGFCAFCGAIAFVFGFLYAFITYRNRETMSRVWISWFLCSGCLYLGFMASYATTAEVFCVYSDSVANHKYICEGYTAAAFFSSISAAISAFGLFAAIKERDALKHASHVLAFGLWTLATACTQGGQSKYYCVSEQSTDDYQKDLCEGYGAATFFNVLGFVSALVAVFFACKETGDRDVAQNKVDAVDVDNTHA